MVNQYIEVRNRTVEICASLEPEDYTVQMVIHASPALWQLGHVTWFYEEFILSKHLEGYARFNENCAFLFNSYYNNVGERTKRNERGDIEFSIEQVYAYRKYVDEKMISFLSNENSKEIHQVVEIGLNHEQQHQELLLTDLKFMLFHKKPNGAYRENGCLVHSQNASSNWIKIPEGVYEIGYSGDGFCFDNELGRHKVYLHEFEIQNSLVSNSEYIEFIEAGGYEDFNLWLDEGWAWVQNENISSPLYWKKIDKTWHHFTLGGLLPIVGDEILCHVSFYEAAAFAEWKKMRLPTEFEWEIASEKLNWGSRWEWTNSAYLPYPNFNKVEGALGEYNGKFMINQMVLRGASAATSPNHSRPTYRNFFHPHFQWQFSGIRLAK